MAFVSNHLRGEEKSGEVLSVSENQPSRPESELNRVELEYLLRVLGNVDLKGKEVEMFYNLVVKLQQQYINKQ
jgi:hypothetical protein